MGVRKKNSGRPRDVLVLRCYVVPKTKVGKRGAAKKTKRKR